MPLNCNGANSVSCVKSNRVVDGLQKRSFVANFEENFKIKTIGFKGFSKLPAVLVERCDAKYLDSKNLISKTKQNKPTQNENFTRNNSANAAEKIFKCSVKVVKADLEKLKAELSKRSRDGDAAIQTNRDKTKNCGIPDVVSYKNIFYNVDLPSVHSGVHSIHFDTSGIHSDRNISQNLNTHTIAVNNNKNNSENLNTAVNIDKNVSQNLSRTTEHLNNSRKQKPIVHNNIKKSRKLDVLPVHNNNKEKSKKVDIPVVFNGIEKFHLNNDNIAPVHNNIDSYEFHIADHNDKNINENLYTPVHNNINIPQNLNGLNIKKKSQNIDIPIVLNGIKNLNLENEDLPRVNSDTNASENLDTKEKNGKSISENLDTPFVYKGVRVFLNYDLSTVNPNFNSYVNLSRLDLKKLKSALRKKKKKHKKKRKHSHCPHRIKSKYHKNIFQYPDTPVIDSNGNISHFDTVTDSDFNSPRDSDPSIGDTDTSVSQNSDILDSYLNLYQDYRSKVNTVINPFQHSYTPIVDYKTIQDYKNSIFKSAVNISPDSGTHLIDSTDIESSPDYEPSFVESAINISLDSVTPIVDSDLNLSQYTSETPIVGCDVNLSPYSDSSSYVDTDINISQYSHTPMVGPDVMNISQYADTSMLEPDINFAQDAEGLIDSVMNIAQYTGTPTADFNTNFNTSRTSDVPLSHNETDDSHDSDIQMICASMNMVNLRCKICEKVYSNEKKLQNHEENKHMIIYKAKSNKTKKRVSFSDKVIIHEVSEYHRCRKCSKIFENYRLLKVHMKLKHKKRKCYICDYCSKKFIDRMFFKVHIKLHCDVCGELLRNKKKYVNHRKKVCRVLKLRKCKKCRGRFFKSMDLKDHNYDHLTSCCVCDICKDQFQTKCGVAHHISVQHFNNQKSSLYTVRNLGTERLYLCNFCDESSVDRDLIEKHVQLLPDLNNRAKTGYEGHYFCDQCLKKFDTESDMLYHKWTHFLTTSDNSQIRSKCLRANKKKKTKKTFKTYEKLPGYLQPVVVLEKLKVPEKVVKVVAEPKTLVNVKSCELNNGTIKRRRVRSKLKKTIISEHQCQTCGRYFSSKYSLNRHIENLHSDFENLRCKVCEETFVWPSLLRSHKCIRLKIPEMPFRDARPEILFDNLQEITPSFDDLNINETDDYLNSIDFDIPSPVVELRGYENRYVSSSVSGGTPSPPSSSSSPPGSDGRYVPMHSLGYKVTMQEVPIEF